MQKILLVALVVGIYGPQVMAEKPVKLVIDVIRHGARTATFNDANLFPDVKWDMTEELTPVGERQECLLGHLRRSQYVGEGKLLSESFDTRAVKARTTDTRRTFMSAQAYLIGLYPHGLAQLNNNQMSLATSLLLPPIELEDVTSIVKELGNKSMPFDLPIIPIMSVNYTSEDLLLSADCPLIDYYITGYFYSPTYRDLVLSYKYATAWSHVKKAYTNINDDVLLKGNNAYLIADFIICAAADGKKNSGISDTDVESLKKFVTAAQYDIFTANEVMNKIGMNTFADVVADNMNKAFNNKSETHYFLYSAHDITLMVITIGLRRMPDQSVKIPSTIDFASNILFELRGNGSNKADWDVKIYYNGENIYNGTYATFEPEFRKLGKLDDKREVVCDYKKSLRPGWLPGKRTGIIEDFTLN